MRLNSCLTLAVILMFGVAACSSDNDGRSTENDNTDNESSSNEGGSPDEMMQQRADASYKVTFNANWSQTTHPTNFPSGPHFSGLVGAVHGEQAIFWEPGQIATEGMELMAETGSKSLLLEEVQFVISEGRALSEISGNGVASSPGVATIEFTVTRDNPLVTLVSMLAPSPDWFVGVHSLSLLASSGQFHPSLTVDLAVYDSGTDSGLQYTSADQDSLPREPITLLNSEQSDSDLTNGLPIVGQFVFELQ